MLGVSGDCSHLYLQVSVKLSLLAQRANRPVPLGSYPQVGSGGKLYTVIHDARQAPFVIGIA